ncbi:MAG: glycosyltransferase family 4 protein [Ilumatobacteraceae bacterium]
MRVLMLSWEFPPHVIGGISTHVEGLARALVRAGHEVVVCTVSGGGTVDDIDEVIDGVRVLRADTSLPWLPDDEFVTRMASINHHLVRVSARLGGWTPDVVHAHDWMTAWAGDTLKSLHGVPLVATVHATERGRHGGHLPPGLPGTINSIEWWLTYQARSVIACSQFMVHEIIDGFDLPPGKVRLVPNGIDIARWSPRARRSTPDRPLVVAWGRVQFEKGFQVLARAMGELRHRVPGIRCVIAGRGTYLPDLQSTIDFEGVGDIVQLAGFVPDDELRSLLAEASCVVIPSLYEPFGIVALEGMAAGAPTVVARTGGLAEIVGGTGAGVLFEPGDHHALADAIAGVVTDPTGADRLRTEAASLLRRTYSWDAVAASTIEVYRDASR